MTRPLRASSTAAVFVLLIAAAAHPGAQRSRAAQQVAVPEKVTPDDVAKAQRVVEKAAADHKVVLTDPVKREMAIEIASQDAATRAAEASTTVPPQKKPTASTDPAPPADLPVSMEAKVDRLFSKPELSRAGMAVDVSKFTEAVSSDKFDQVRLTLASDVTQQAEFEKLTLPDDVKNMIVDDLEKQTKGLAASGMAVEVIRAKNASYFKMVAAGFQDGQITQTRYQQIQQQLFQPLVTVHIESTPSGATFSFDNNIVGPTNLDQKFEPGKTYQFQLVLSGFMPVKQPFYVPAADQNAVFQRVLFADTGGSQPSSDSSAAAPGGTPKPEDDHRFPIWWVVGVVVIAGALFFLVRRR